jgi:hypothetical protein
MTDLNLLRDVTIELVDVSLHGISFLHTPAC